MSWLKQQFANVTGTQEPVYGPSAIRTVSAQSVPATELTKDNMRWKLMDSTCVETQTFYMTAENGCTALVQAIYSNVFGLRTTCQFSSKIFFNDGRAPVFATDPIPHCKFSQDKFSLESEKCTFTLSEDGQSYTVKSTISSTTTADLKFTKVAPGFVAGNDGTSYFGTDPAKPWGSMRHAFWPRVRVEGTLTTPQGTLDMKGHGLLSHALQGMKPHHAAARWNFVNFHSPTYSAVMMEFTTPKSYGSTVVNVGGIAIDGALLCAGSTNTAAHTEVKGDAECNWPEPGAVAFKWNGKSQDGREVHADLSGPLGTRLDRIDVMAEVPKFVKNILANAAGARPYIYQYGTKMTLKITVGNETKEEEGWLFSEATFIS